MNDYIYNPQEIIQAKQRQDYSSIPYDYGKYINIPQIQKPFIQFLEQEKLTSNKEAYHYWTEANTAETLVKKISLLTQGAEKGNDLCAKELGEYYLKEDGVPKNNAKAEKYLVLAARCGIVDAMFHLGMLYMDKKDDKALEALDWLCKAAINGQPNAFACLARHLINPILCEQIEARIAVYFKKVCDKDECTAAEYEFIGLCFYTGICCAKNKEWAKQYWVQGEEQGNLYCGVLLEICADIFKEAEEDCCQNDVEENQMGNNNSGCSCILVLCIGLMVLFGVLMSVVLALNGL